MPFDSLVSVFCFTPRAVIAVKDDLVQGGRGPLFKLVKNYLSRGTGRVKDGDVLEIFEQYYIFGGFINQSFGEMRDCPMPRKISSGVVLFAARFSNVRRLWSRAHGSCVFSRDALDICSSLNYAAHTEETKCPLVASLISE